MESRIKSDLNDSYSQLNTKKCVTLTAVQTAYS